MITIGDIAAYLEDLAPLAWQEDYDNAGLLIGNVTAPCTGCLITLDVTEEIVAEAATKGLNLIVAHHPLIFRGLKRLTGSNYVERTVLAAIRKGIAVYAIHTNLDNISEGVNAMIGERLGLQELEILRPKQPDRPDIGAGMIGYLPEALAGKDFLQKLKSTFAVDCIRHTRLLEQPVRKVAFCGGAGSFLLPDAIRAGADAFVTGDFKYHEFFDADGRILIADIGHYESEQFTTQLLHRFLSQKFPNFAVRLAETYTNPIKYFT